MNIEDQQQIEYMFVSSNRDGSSQSENPTFTLQVPLENIVGYAVLEAKASVGISSDNTFTMRAGYYQTLGDGGSAVAATVTISRNYHSPHDLAQEMSKHWYIDVLHFAWVSSESKFIAWAELTYGSNDFRETIIHASNPGTPFMRELTGFPNAVSTTTTVQPDITLDNGRVLSGAYYVSGAPIHWLGEQIVTIHSNLGATYAQSTQTNRATDGDAIANIPFSVGNDSAVDGYYQAPSPTIYHFNRQNFTKIDFYTTTQNLGTIISLNSALLWIRIRFYVASELTNIHRGQINRTGPQRIISS